MWRATLERAGALISGSVERSFISEKSCLGLVCTKSLQSAVPIAVLPFWLCLAPLTALASPWGDRLKSALSSYSVSDGDVRVDYAKESALTTAYTALALTHPSPVREYLSMIDFSNDMNEATLQQKLSQRNRTALEAIDELNTDVLHSIHSDLQDQDLIVPFAALNKAHHLCASRCVAVPCSERALGGPSLVPFVDLINHDPGPPNVEVSLLGVNEVHELLSPYLPKQKPKAVIDSTPFHVVVTTSVGIEAGTELHYQYVDEQEDPELSRDALFWASRFRFIPEF